MTLAERILLAIQSAWAYLGGIEYAQSVVILAVAFGVPWLLRSVFPHQWEAATNRLTAAVRPYLGEKLTAAWRKAIQGVPSLLAAAAFAAIVEGADLGALLRFEFHAVFAPLIHESLRAYRGGRFPAAGSLGALLFLTLSATGCTGSLQQARASGELSRKVGTLSAASIERCESLDSQHLWAGTIGKGTAVLGTGLAGLAAGDEFRDEKLDVDARKALLIGATASAAISGAALWLSEGAAASHARECQ